MASSGPGIFVGTDLKFNVTITSQGFDMDTDGWTVEIKRGARSIVFDKSECIHDDTDGKWYVCFSTAELGPGDYYAIVTASVVDADFDDGDRTEVQKMLLMRVESV